MELLRAYMTYLLRTGQRLDGAAVDLIVLLQAKCGDGFPDLFHSIQQPNQGDPRGWGHGVGCDPLAGLVGHRQHVHDRTQESQNLQQQAHNNFLPRFSASQRVRLRSDRGNGLLGGPFDPHPQQTRPVAEVAR